MGRRREVDTWFRETNHPLKDLMLEVREIILKTDARMDECIKWKTPTFTFEGNMASFNPNTKKHVSLMFHTGAKIPGTFPSLEGGGTTARYMKFHDAREVRALSRELKAVTKAWIAMRSKGTRQRDSRERGKTKLARHRPGASRSRNSYRSSVSQRRFLERGQVRCVDSQLGARPHA